MFDIDTCLGFITGFTAKKISDAFNERLLKKGITRVQWIAMYYINKSKKISQVELGNMMDIKPSTVARLMDRMEKEGYIFRCKDKEDRRITNISLTKNGEELMERLLPEGEKMSELVSEGIANDEIEIFKKVLNKMVSNVDKH